MNLAQRCFAFEANFVHDLRCLPMAVRRKLDLAGVKLKLVHWHGLEPDERQRLLAWPDHATALEDLRRWLLERSAELPQGPARPLPPAQREPWQQTEAVPPVLLASCEQLALRLAAERWSQLDELQRFALVKLSHPGHEHRNLPRALAEFGLLQAEPAPVGPGWDTEDKSGDR
ncbi:MAG: nitrate reductase associated protein [Synechococcus sp.]